MPSQNVFKKPQVFKTEGGFAFLRWVGQVLVQAVPGLIRAVTMVATVWDKRA